jgi:arsenate reductase (glutaredoxin)
VIRIYHNSRCSKSRSALALVEQHGQPFEVIHYLDTTPNADELKVLLSQLGITARQLLRTGEDIYKELQLDDISLRSDVLIEAMVRHPQLIERPIVVADGKAVIGRPPEAVQSILK